MKTIRIVVLLFYPEIDLSVIFIAQTRLYFRFRGSLDSALKWEACERQWFIVSIPNYKPCSLDLNLATKRITP